MANVASGKYATPGSVSIEQTTGQQQSGQNQTGFIQSGQNDTGQQTGLQTCTQQLLISEIFAGDQTYAPYIEIYAPNGYAGNILLSGQGMVTINLENKEFGIITQNASNFLPSQKVYTLATLNIAETGGFQLYGQSGQLLDSA